jgi:hypothetical protein
MTQEGASDASVIKSLRTHEFPPSRRVPGWGGSNKENKKHAEYNYEIRSSIQRELHEGDRPWWQGAPL